MKKNTVKPPQSPTLLQDIRLIFATILTDPGSSLAYGADAVIAVTAASLYHDYSSGLVITLVAGFIIMCVYLLALIVYNDMTKNHVHPILGGGAFVSSTLTAQKIRTPWLKSLVTKMGKLGTASLLADFPATQAISLVAGVEALYFIPREERFTWAIFFLLFISVIQRYGLGRISRYMIWPVVSFYICNLGIQFFGLYEVLTNGWEQPILNQTTNHNPAMFWIIILGAVANGSTLITGVEVGYSSVNFPYHKGKAIRISMWILYGIVASTYILQLVNFLGLGINQEIYTVGNLPPVPIQIAQHVGGDSLATPFGLLTALMLLLAAQTAQSDFPLEILRASRSNFFPKEIGDSAWRKIKSTLGIGGHDGVYNPRATIILGALSLLIVYFFPHSHDIESMYGLAVITAICVDIGSYFLRKLRLHYIFSFTGLGLIVMLLMFFNILYNKFFEGAWFIVLLMIVFLLIFAFSAALYDIWAKKISTVPIELGLWYPAFSNLPVDRKNIVLVSKFHPGVVHFLKNHIKTKTIPLIVHFQTDSNEQLPDKLPHWFENVIVDPKTDMITTIVDYVRAHKPDRVHMIPLLVSGLDTIKHYYFGNSIDALKNAVSQYADVQVEYNRERIVITKWDILQSIFPYLESRKQRKLNGEKSQLNSE